MNSEYRRQDDLASPAGDGPLLTDMAATYRSQRLAPAIDVAEPLKPISGIEFNLLGTIENWAHRGGHLWFPLAIGIAGFFAGTGIWLSAIRSSSRFSVGVLVVVVALFVAGLVRLLMVMIRHQSQVNSAARVEANELKVDALTDELTGLTNRKGISLEIEKRLETSPAGKLLGVLFVDLDRLQIVNDSLGHLAGDRVIGVAAARIRSAVRDGDIIGRFGGDEFVVVSSGLPTIRDMEILGSRIVRSLRKPIVLGEDLTQVVSASIGISWQPTTGPGSDAGSEPTQRDPKTDAANLLRDADAALRYAKKQGGSSYTVFDESLRSKVVSRLRLEQQLRRGLRDGEILVHYQPIVDHQKDSIDCVEALVRWQHPTAGLIYPSEFLGIAAESLLIVELGELVVLQACRNAVEWSKQLGRPISVAVNIGERQLLDRNLTDLVSKSLAYSGLDPAQLELEIAEDLIMEKVDESIAVLRQLDLLGVRLAIDDFGTSRASLSRLKSLSMVSVLKLDRAFVEGLGTSDIDLKIADAVVSLATSLDMSVVAEGVETRQQAQILNMLGVDRMQGFYFCRPQPAEEIFEVLSAPKFVPHDAAHELSANTDLLQNPHDY